jgi:hypothetical protein
MQLVLRRAITGKRRRLSGLPERDRPPLPLLSSQGFAYFEDY